MAMHTLNHTRSPQLDRRNIPAHLKRQSLRSQVRLAIIDLVLNGELPAGQRINETELARRLGVSQTPVREALLSLEGQSFLTAETGKGFRVRDLDPDEVRQIYPVLATLESLALESAQLPDTDALAALRSLNAEFLRTGLQSEEAIDLDNRLHSKLVEGCQNPFLLDLITQVRRSANRYEHAHMRQPGQVKLSFEQHTKILDALETRSLKRAARLMLENDLAGTDTLINWLSHNPNGADSDTAVAADNDANP